MAQETAAEAAGDGDGNAAGASSTASTAGSAGAAGTADTEASGTGDRSPRSVVRDNLIFFLGLVPLVIAAMRVYLMGQGDVSVILTLIKTLDVKQLILGTFIRFIGLFGVATTGYIFARIAWPRLVSRPDPALSGAGIVLATVFLAGLGCVYPEQVWDSSNPAWGPVDVVRSVIWVIVGFVFLRLAWFAILRFVPDQSGEGRTLTLRRALRGFWRPETLLLGPVVLFLFWTYLVTNDRMWMPAQVIVVKSGVIATPTAADRNKLYAVPLDTGSVAFVGYVVADDGTQQTVVRPSGGVLYIKDADLVATSVPCQFEPDFDPNDDAPLMTRLPEFPRILGKNETPQCDAVLGRFQQQSG